MFPTPDQQRPVLSIDLGASYTKLALRPSWSLNPTTGNPVNPSVLQSQAMRVEEAFYVPSVIYDPGKGRPWQFGKDARGPAAKMIRLEIDLV
jgi:hypothetical protein